MEDQYEYVDVKTASELTKIPATTIRYRLQQKSIRYLLFGKRYRVAVKDNKLIEILTAD